MTVTEIHNGTIVRFENKIWKVLEKEISGHGKVGRTVHMRLKDVTSGNVAEQNFKSDADLEVLEANVVKMEYQYKEDDFYVFMNTQNYEQCRFNKEALGKQAVFLKENSEIEALVVEDKPLMIEFPETVTLKVDMASEGVKGTDKEVTLENGLKVTVPHFVTAEDSVVVNTEDFSYVERVTTKSMGNSAVAGTGGGDGDDD